MQKYRPSGVAFATQSFTLKVYTFKFLIMLSCNGIEHFDSKVSPPEVTIAIFIMPLLCS